MRQNIGGTFFFRKMIAEEFDLQGRNEARMLKVCGDKLLRTKKPVVAIRKQKALRLEGKILQIDAQILDRDDNEDEECNESGEMD